MSKRLRGNGPTSAIGLRCVVKAELGHKRPVVDGGVSSGFKMEAPGRREKMFRLYVPGEGYRFFSAHNECEAQRVAENYRVSRQLVQAGVYESEF